MDFARIKTHLIPKEKNLKCQMQDDKNLIIANVSQIKSNGGYPGVPS